MYMLLYFGLISICSNIYLHNGGSFLRRSSGIINLVKSHSKMVLVSFPSIIRDLLPCIRCLGDLFALEIARMRATIKVVARVNKSPSSPVAILCHVYLLSIYVKLANSLYHCLIYGFMRNKES